MSTARGGFGCAHEPAGVIDVYFAAPADHRASVHRHDATARVGHLQRARSAPQPEPAGPDRQDSRPIRLSEPETAVVHFQPTFEPGQHVRSALAMTWEEHTDGGPGIVKTAARRKNQDDEVDQCANGHTTIVVPGKGASL
jgi:hypothetical protein